MRIASNSGTTVEESFNIALATKVQKDLHGRIRFLVQKNLPLSRIENNEFREFSKHKTNFSVKRMRATMHKLVEGAEEKIKMEMKEASRGAILHGDWS